LSEPDGPRVSIVVPVFNEERSLPQLVAEIERAMALPWSYELLLVDDGSTDGTREVLAGLAEAHPETVRYCVHPANLGKGAAVRTALAMATGDVVVIQDADAEYHPEDYPAALRLIEGGWAEAVYGSRFLGPHRVFMLWHYVGNRVLTAIANVLTSGILTDMETGFKVIRTAALRDLDLQSSSSGTSAPTRAGARSGSPCCRCTPSGWTASRTSREPWPDAISR
jgi:glycosyltransferase involved in cell wall biosynthesis